MWKKLYAVRKFVKRWFLKHGQNFNRWRWNGEKAGKVKSVVLWVVVIVYLNYMDIFKIDLQMLALLLISPGSVWKPVAYLRV